MKDRRIADLRRDYKARKLRKTDVGRDPLEFFSEWFDQALESGIADANAMLLATVDADGQPSARTVLLKGVDKRGFIFYTNYASRKGRHLAQNPRVALCFQWLGLERQVRIEGEAEIISREESDVYFQSRPFESRVGAHVSRQSEVIGDREQLERDFNSMLEKYADGKVPLPDDWGGYVVRPNLIEFWQGRPSRLHDRIVFRRATGDAWTVARISP